jgi:hypothetical protein
LMKSSSAKFICGWVEVIEFIHQASISQNIETLQKANFLVLPMFWHNCCNAVTMFFLASVLMSYERHSPPWKYLKWWTVMRLSASHKRTD